MTQVRTIKKYPNRRLYDTAESRYITLADVRQLVVDDIPFAVVDQKSGDDITRSILLQVISEQEASGEPILTQDFLSEMIRAYSRSVPGFVGNYLEQSLSLFLRQQQDMRRQVLDLMDTDPVVPMRDLARRNWNRWITMQHDLFEVMLGQPPSRGSQRSETTTDDAAAPAPRGRDSGEG